MHLSSLNLTIIKMIFRVNNKTKVFTVLGCVHMVACFLFYYLYSENKEKFRAQMRVSRISRLLQGMPSAHGDNGKCLLQKYNLYDKSIASYINEEPVKLDCTNSQPYLTYMDWEGNLHWNHSEGWRFNRFMKCHYKEVLRQKDSDNLITYGPLVEIVSFPIFIKQKTIRVICEKNDAQVYVNIHMQIMKPTPQRITINNKIASHRPSVLLLLIDSLSRGQFIRALPRTYSYLVREKGMIVFEGINKVGDNTRPNTLALLTGLQYDTSHSYMPHMPKPSSEHSGGKIIKYDDDPIIWKYFQQQGYFTLYGEEYLDTIFNYEGEVKTMDGFVREPVDYYFRPNYLALTKNHWNLLHRFGVFYRYCLGNERTYQYLMNYTEEFLTEMADLKYFAFSFFVELSHEKLNDIKNMDEDLVGMFERLHSKGALNNTIVMVMGDHGHRFSGIRSTPIGRLEERMPFFGVHLPDRFKMNFPHIEEGLLSNTNILLSWYDIHAMLRDILEDNLSKESSRKKKEMEVGSSIFRPVRDNRTCEEIGIPVEYCTCGMEKEISLALPLVNIIAEVLINNINEKLIDSHLYSNKKDRRKCAMLKLLEIHSATLMASWHRFDERDIPVNFRLVITTSPGNAKFEGVVAYSEVQDNMRVIGDVNRINKYGNQSACISDSILRLYCYCI